MILFCHLNRAYLPPDKIGIKSQKSDRFAFINMSSKTHQALFVRRLSGSGFPGEMGIALHYREFHWAGKVQGLATPTFQLKRSY